MTKRTAQTLSMELETNAQISYDVLQRIKNVKDVRSCLDGLKLLHKALQLPDKAARVVNELSRLSPRLEEVLAVWDTSAKSQHEEMQKMAIIVVVDLLRTFEEDRGGAVGESSRDTILTLVQELVSSRIKVFYYHLSSSKDERVCAALWLLAAICSFSISCAEETVRNFDFSLSALSGLARPRRQRKDESDSDFIARTRREWNDKDPLRRPRRCAFISWTVSLLKSSNARLLKSVLSIKPLMQGVLHYLSSDPPNVQMEVLTALSAHIVVDRVSPKLQPTNLDSLIGNANASARAVDVCSLSAADRSRIWTDAALGQLTKISARYDGKEMREETSDGQNKDANRAAELAHTVLSSISTIPENGMCVTSTEAKSFRLTHSGDIRSFSPQRKSLLRWVKDRLDPLASIGHWILLKECVRHDPALAAAGLLARDFSFSHTFEPSVSGVWLAHMGILCLLMDIISGIPVGLSSRTGGGSRSPRSMAPSVHSSAVRACLMCAAPDSLSRGALSRGIQHKDNLVRHITLSLMSHMLRVLEAVATDAAEGYREASSVKAMTVNHRKVLGSWEELIEGIQHRCREVLPDIQPVIAQLSLAEKSLLPVHITPGASDAGESHLPRKKTSNATAKQNSMDKIISCDEAWFILEACLRTICIWRRILPFYFQENNIEVDRLLPSCLSTLDRQLQFSYLNLLNSMPIVIRQPKYMCGAKSFDLHDPALISPQNINSSALVVVLQVLMMTATDASCIQKMAHQWLHHRLLDTFIFEDNMEEAFVWIETIPYGRPLEGLLCCRAMLQNPMADTDPSQRRRGSANVASHTFILEFFVNSVSLLFRRMEDFVALLNDLPLDQKSPPNGARSFSLLSMCALRQLVRILSSPKRKDEDKHAIAFYVSSAVTMIALQQSEEELWRYTCLCLAMLSSEAQRLEFEDGGVDGDASPHGSNAAGKESSSRNKSKSKSKKRKRSLDTVVEDSTSYSLDRDSISKMLTGFGEAGHPLKILVDRLFRNLWAFHHHKTHDISEENRVCAEEGGSGKRQRIDIDQRQMIDAINRLVGFELGEGLPVVSRPSAYRHGDSPAEALMTPSFPIFIPGLTELMEPSLSSDAAQCGRLCDALPLCTIPVACLILFREGNATDTMARARLPDPVLVSCFESSLKRLSSRLKSSVSGSSALVVRHALRMLPWAAAAAVGSSTQGSSLPLTMILQCLKSAYLACCSSPDQKDCPHCLFLFGTSKDVVVAAALLADGASAEGDHHDLRVEDQRNSDLPSHRKESLHAFFDYVGWMLLTGKENCELSHVRSAFKPICEWAMERALVTLSSKSYKTCMAIWLFIKQLMPIVSEESFSSVLDVCESLVGVVRSSVCSRNRRRKSRDEDSKGIDSVYGHRAAQVLQSLLSQVSKNVQVIEKQGLRDRIRSVVDQTFTLIVKAASHDEVREGEVSPSGEHRWPEDILLCVLLNGSIFKDAIRERLLSKGGKLLEHRLRSLSPERTESVVLLLEHCPPTFVVFPSLLAEVMKAAESIPRKTIRRRALSFLMPSVLAYVRCQSLLLSEDESRSQQDLNGKETSAKIIRNIRKGVDLLFPPLVSWLCSKHPRHVSKPPLDTAELQSLELSKPAGLLQRYALPCFSILLETKFQDETCNFLEEICSIIPKLLGSLSKAHGWMLPPSGSDIDLVAPGLNLVRLDLGPTTTAKVLSIGLIFHNLLEIGREIWENIAYSERLKLLATTVESLCSIAASCLKLSDRKFRKEHDLNSTNKKHVKDGSFDWKEGATSSADNLTSAVFDVLDSSVGNAVAALTDEERKTEDFMRISSYVCCTLAPAILDHKARDPASIKVLRRLCAALLPKEEDVGGSLGAALEINCTTEEPSVSKVSRFGSSLFQDIVRHSPFKNILARTSGPPAPVPVAVIDAVSQPMHTISTVADIEPCERLEDPVYNNKNIELKKEYCELLETLLDIHWEFGAYGKAVPEETLEVEMNEIFPFALESYGASLSQADQALWSLIRALNYREWKRCSAERVEGSVQAGDSKMGDILDADAEDVEALLHGPLSQSCFAWGPKASGALRSMLNQTDVENSISLSNDLMEALSIDPLRCVLSVCHFPEWRSLVHDDPPPEIPRDDSRERANTRTTIASVWSMELMVNVRRISEVQFSTERCCVTSSLSIAATNQEQDMVSHSWGLHHSPAGYDPAFLLLFSLTALQKGLMSCRSFVELGLLSLCFRATAARDLHLRAAAFEALAVLWNRLNGNVVRADAESNHRSDVNENHQNYLTSSAAPEDAMGISSSVFSPIVSIHHPDKNLLLNEENHRHTFRDRQQVLMLLSWFRNAITKPFMRFPSFHAVLLAEFAFVLCSPGSSMYRHVSKLIVRTPHVPLSYLPLFKRLSHSGSLEAFEERKWMLRLLLAGLRSAEDVVFYRRMHVVDLVLDLQDFALLDRTTRKIGLQILCRASCIPKYARVLCQGPGLVIWLARIAHDSLRASMPPGISSRPSHLQRIEDVKDALVALQALNGLIRLRASRGHGAGLRWQGPEDFAMVCKKLLWTALVLTQDESSANDAELVSLIAKAWENILGLCAYVETKLDGCPLRRSFLSGDVIACLEDCFHGHHSDASVKAVLTICSEVRNMQTCCEPSR